MSIGAAEQRASGLREAMNYQYSYKMSLGDIMALICALALLVGFFLPWVTFLGLSANGWAILSHANGSGAVWLFLILVGGIGGTLMSIWGLMIPLNRRTASIGSLIAGLAALVPFAVSALHSGTPSSSSQFNSGIGIGLNEEMSFIGIGLWLTILGAIGLVVQVFFPRRPEEAYPSRPAPYQSSAPPSYRSIRAQSVGSSSIASSVVRGSRQDACRYCGAEVYPNHQTCWQCGLGPKPVSLGVSLPSQAAGWKLPPLPDEE